MLVKFSVVVILGCEYLGIMNISRFQQFKQLHYSNEPLLLPNVWNVGSALDFQASAFRAVGTSSAALAAAQGFEDGEKLPFDELVGIVSAISSRTDLLVSVDIEGGYGTNADEIAANIMRLAEVGAVGVNIEDSIVTKGRHICDASSMAGLLERVRKILASRGVDVFLNVRTDTYLLGVDDKLDETKNRIRLYEKAGADGVFIPCLTDLREMSEFCSMTSLPVNVMCMPDLPDFDSVGRAGVKRISMGNFMYERIRRFGVELIGRISESGTFSPLF